MRKILLVLLSICVSACGFKPMYSEYYDGKAELVLSEVQIGKVASKRDYRLKNYLEDELNPHDLNNDKHFILDVDVSDSISDLLVQQDSTIVQKQYNVNATYKIKENKTGQVIDSGNIIISVSFSELPSEYATYAISERTLNNSLKEVAAALKKRVAIALLKYQDNVEHEDIQH